MFNVPLVSSEKCISDTPSIQAGRPRGLPHGEVVLPELTTLCTNRFCEGARLEIGDELSEPLFDETGEWRGDCVRPRRVCMRSLAKSQNASHCCCWRAYSLRASNEIIWCPVTLDCPIIISSASLTGNAASTKTAFACSAVKNPSLSSSALSKSTLNRLSSDISAGSAAAASIASSILQGDTTSKGLVLRCVGSEDKKP